LFNQNEFDFFEQLESDIAVYRNSGKLCLWENFHIITTPR